MNTNFERKDQIAHRKYPKKKYDRTNDRDTMNDGSNIDIDNNSNNSIAFQSL